MADFGDLECDVEILRDVVQQIEQDVKGLTQELVRVKQLLQDLQRDAKDATRPSKSRHH